jgi:hypothetical protein
MVEKVNEKINITGFHLERELVSNQLRLIMTDEAGEEFVLSQRTVCPEGGQSMVINKKSEDWYFNPKNKTK